METRKKELDLMKLIALIIVCFSHVFQRVYPNAISTRLFDFCYSLHMAIFFFVSGLLFKEIDKYKELFRTIIKRFCRYIYPAVLFTIITIFVVERYSNNSFSYWMNEFLVRTDTFYWFLIDLFIIELISFIASYFSSIIHNKIIKKIIKYSLLLIGVIPLVLIFKYKGPDFLSLDLLLYYYFFFFFGVITSDINIKKLSLKIGITIICVVCYTILFIKLKNWVQFSNFSLNDYSFIKYELVALLGVLSIYYASQIIVKNKTIAKISSYGKYSLSFYLIHVLLLRIITPYISKIETANFYSIVFLIVYFVFVLSSSLFISKLIEENKITSLLFLGTRKQNNTQIISNNINY